jgi:GT2 family glycosyltransferase
MGFASSVKGAYAAAERRAGWLLAGGLATAALWNLRQWHRDRRRLEQLARQKPTKYDLELTPRVSILLPAWNEAPNVGPCIESILGLRYPDVELIVCAGGDDGTLEVARQYERPGVVVLEQRPGEGKQRALGRCFEYSSGHVLFLTDADCTLDNACFEATLSPVVTGGEDATTGSWRPLDRQRDQPFVQYQWAHHVYREMWMPDYAPALTGSNAAVTRQALEEVAAFQAEAAIGTDLALSQQLTTAGYSIRFLRESHVQTEYPETLAGYRRQLSRWFRNQLVHEKRWVASSSARSVLWAGSAATILVVAPIAAIFSGSLRSMWVSGVSHLLLAQLRMQGVLRDTVVEQAVALQPLRACGYLPLGWAFTAESLWSLLCQLEKGGQW